MRPLGACAFSATSSSSVPVIDMAAYSKARASEAPPASLVNEVAAACEQWGFFQVVNHGLDTGLRARAEEEQRAFFALPVEVKGISACSHGVCPVAPAPCNDPRLRTLCVLGQSACAAPPTTRAAGMTTS